MNLKHAKALRKLVARFPVSTAVPMKVLLFDRKKIVPVTDPRHGNVLTFKHPAGTRRRVYQDVKHDRATLSL